MKILVHDYAGHPFQVSLSRELARRGHQVVHAYFAGDRGPKGDFKVQAADKGRLTVVPLRILAEYQKGSLLRRRFGDVAYGKAVADLIASERPQLVLSGNTPTEAQSLVLKASRKHGAAFVYWLQDFYSLAVSLILKRKLGVVGRCIGAYYRLLERRQMKSADAVVTITREFEDLATRWGDEAGKVTTIENWGLVDDIVPVEKANPWALEMGLGASFNFLYSGTLGLKHNPMLLVDLARAMRGRAAVVVIGEGVGLDLVKRAKAADALDNLLILPLQPFPVLKQVLGAADVTLAIIEPEAGLFSVPSKVQSYLCAGRPILLAAPADNLAAKVLVRQTAGLVTEPTDSAAFVAAAERLFADAALRGRLSENGRAYASATFDIGVVTDRFEGVFGQALRQHETV